MRKKGFEPDLSISLLLTVPDSGDHRLWAENYFAENYATHQRIFLNETEDNLPIDLIRELITQTSFARTTKEKTAYILCGSEKASLPAQNALLKILEEPPANILIVLVATHGHQLLPTISSRCLEISLGKTQKDAINLAEHVTKTIDFCLEPTNFHFYDLVELADNWQKDEQRDKNLVLVLQNLLLVSKNLNFALDKIRAALESLKKNGNVKLVIEDCLFTIKKHYLNDLSISKR